ncbi:MAG: MerR family transcriptional regulator, partial [Thermoanaerobaculia bacterium]
PWTLARMREFSGMSFMWVIREGFSWAEAAGLSGRAPRQLDHWDRQGFLRPSLQQASGYGSNRRYSFADIVRLRVAARLRASGVGLPRIRSCARALARLDEAGGGDLARARLLVIGNRVLWAQSDQEVVDLLKGGQLVLVFSLEDAIAQAAGAVARLSRESEESPPTRQGGRRTQVL